MTAAMLSIPYVLDLLEGRRAQTRTDEVAMFRFSAPLEEMAARRAALFAEVMAGRGYYVSDPSTLLGGPDGPTVTITVTATAARAQNLAAR